MGEYDSVLLVVAARCGAEVAIGLYYSPAHAHIALQHQVTLCAPKGTPWNSTFHTARSTLHTPHLTFHTHLGFLSSSKPFSAPLISSEHCWSLLLPTKLFWTHLNSSLLNSSQHFSCHLTFQRNMWNTSQYSVPLHIQNLVDIASRKHYYPALLSTCSDYMVLQSIFHYYFVVQSLHKILLSTTLYYKTCATHFLVLLRTTRRAQCTSQYDFDY